MIAAKNIYEEICNATTEDERGHWMSDLYCKVTQKTKEVIDQYEYRSNVEIFIDQITHTPWYDIPFAYPYRDI